MTSKATKAHHYVPQFYLRHFALDDQFFAINLKTLNHFRPTSRQVAHENHLYRLEGKEPTLAEDFFSEVETIAAPIMAKIIESENLPDLESDDFVSLLSFIAILIARQPSQLSKIEEFYETVIHRSTDLFAHSIPDEGATLVDGQKVTRQEAINAVKAYEEGRLKLHVPKDHSIGASLGTVNTITECLIKRNWMLAKAEGNQFITSSTPVLLLWDNLAMHQRHSVGHAMKNTTVYFPISPNLMMIGKFEDLIPESVLGASMIAELNSLQMFFGPLTLVAQSEAATIQLGMRQVPFKELGRALKSNRSAVPEEE